MHLLAVAITVISSVEFFQQEFSSSSTFCCCCPLSLQAHRGSLHSSGV